MRRISRQAEMAALDVVGLRFSHSRSTFSAALRCSTNVFQSFSLTLFILFAYTSPVLAELLLKWPLIRQLRGEKDAAVSERTRELRPKNEAAEVARSICPYCGVGCGQLVYHRGGKLLSIEGDPQSPISRGHLCPKGSEA